MKMMNKLLLAVTLMLTTVFAQAFEPKQPIEIVVTYPPGGASDSVARIVSEIFTDRGWPSVVLNKPGADSVIGTNYAAKAKPDGQTLFVGSTGALDSNIVFGAEGMEYNEKSFVPIVPLANISYVLTMPANSPINNYQEFKEYVKANPSKFKLGFWNSNTANILYDWAKKEGLPKPTIVLYKGSGPQMTDVVGGHIPFAFDTWLAVAPYLETDKVKVIATLDKNGLAVVKKLRPSNPSISIAQIHPDLDFGIWYGLWAPAGTPQPILNEMNTVINTAFNDPKYRAKIEALNIRNYGGTADSLSKLQAKNLAILKRISQDLNK